MVIEEYAFKVVEYNKRFITGDLSVKDGLDSLRDFYNAGSNFQAILVRLIQKADHWNRRRLKHGFPDVVGLFELCEEGGVEGYNTGPMDFQRQITEGL